MPTSRFCASGTWSASDASSTAFRDPTFYFHRYARLSDAEAIETATSIWTRINLVNLHENILPTRQRADLILEKARTTR